MLKEDLKFKEKDEVGERTGRMDGGWDKSKDSSPFVGQ